MAQNDVKVFISWSGELSRVVAERLRDWLKLFFDRAKPWMSEMDIAAGARGLTEIERQLQRSKFGIIVVTAENQERPWLNFEAGALSKALTRNGKTHVVPLLVDLPSRADLKGPLAQFQAVEMDPDGLRHLVRSLASAAGIEEFVADQRFGMFVRSLILDLDKAVATVADLSSDERPSIRIYESATDAMSWEEQRALQALVRTKLDTKTAVFIKAQAEELGVHVWQMYRSESTEITLLVTPQEARKQAARDLKRHLSNSLDIDIIIRDWAPERPGEGEDAEEGGGTGS